MSEKLDGDNLEEEGSENTDLALFDSKDGALCAKGEFESFVLFDHLKGLILEEANRLNLPQEDKEKLNAALANYRPPESLLKDIDNQFFLPEISRNVDLAITALSIVITFSIFAVFALKEAGKGAIVDAIWILVVAAGTLGLNIGGSKMYKFLHPSCRKRKKFKKSLSNIKGLQQNTAVQAMLANPDVEVMISFLENRFPEILRAKRAEICAAILVIEEDRELISKPLKDQDPEVVKLLPVELVTQIERRISNYEEKEKEYRSILEGFNQLQEKAAYILKNLKRRQSASKLKETLSTHLETPESEDSNLETQMQELKVEINSLLATMGRLNEASVEIDRDLEGPLVGDFEG